MNSSVDLTNCDREPIHIPGSVQPFGFLLALLPDFSIGIASKNTTAFLGRDYKELLRRPIDEILTDEAVASIRERIDYLTGKDAVERMFGLVLQENGPRFDIAIHFSGAYLIVEAEPSVAERNVNSGELVRAMLARLDKISDLRLLCQEAARQVKVLTGFDRVMVYRFHADDSGEVVAEAANSNLEPYLGLHYPASDIPKQARALYQRNWLRIISDINASPAFLAADAAHSPELLDLSMSVLRSVSPIHIEYLRNMGVGASMSVSILRDGRLWGLIACHHYGPRHIPFERRTAAELFGQMFSWILEGRDREGNASYEARARKVQERLIEKASHHVNGVQTLTDFIDDYRKMVDCDGIAIWTDQKLILDGHTPTDNEIKDLISFINRTSPGRIVASGEIASVFPAGAAFRDRAAGFLAIPISRAPRDCLLFFRREILRSVNWAGAPEKVYAEGPLGPRLTPRKSFELWQETVRGQSKPWSKSDLSIAESLRITLLEVILQLADVAVREQRAAQERQELLIAELNHRVRNILSLVRALITQSKESNGSLESFVNVLGGRIQALARAHDQITNQNWAPAPLRLLLESEAGAYLGARAERIVMAGPGVSLDPRAFTTVALVVHELMTNSAKYGALADSSGEVEVSWQIGPHANLIIDWKERGGPPVQPPSRQGFGTTIIERSIPFDLKGEAELRFDLLGVNARFVVPAPYVTLSSDVNGASISSDLTETSRGKLSGTVLIVEDNLIIALGAEDILMELGAQQVETAASVAQALLAIDQNRPSFALLDLNLGRENSIPVGEKLQSLGIPFIFATGYGERAPIPEQLGRVPVIQKPYTYKVVEAALGTAKQN